MNQSEWTRPSPKMVHYPTSILCRKTESLPCLTGSWGSKQLSSQARNLLQPLGLVQDFL